jgi:hypothetical protein
MMLVLGMNVLAALSLCAAMIYQGWSQTAIAGIYRESDIPTNIWLPLLIGGTIEITIGIAIPVWLLWRIRKNDI